MRGFAALAAQRSRRPQPKVDVRRNADQKGPPALLPSGLPEPLALDGFTAMANWEHRRMLAPCEDARLLQPSAVVTRRAPAGVPTGTPAARGPGRRQRRRTRARRSVAAATPAERAAARLLAASRSTAGRRSARARAVRWVTDRAARPRAHAARRRPPPPRPAATAPSPTARARRGTAGPRATPAPRRRRGRRSMPQRDPARSS